MRLSIINFGYFASMAIHIGEVIHRAIRDKGITAKEFAVGINVSESNIYDLYKRKSIDVDRLIKISHFLDTDLLEIYYSDDLMSKFKIKGKTNLQMLNEELLDTIQRKNRIIEELEKLNSVLQKHVDLFESKNPK